MGTITVNQSAAVGAPAELVYRLVADDAHRAQFLPDAVSGFRTVQGGVGAGTVHAFTLSAGRRQRPYVLTVAEPQPGRVLTETDQGSSLMTTWTVTPSGGTCTVQITTTWSGAGGLGGFFERTFAPRALAGVYAQQLERLGAHARAQA